MKKKKLLKIIEEFKHDLEDLLEMNKYNSDPTFDVIEGFQRVKYCKECKYPILRLDKLATVLKNGQRVFIYEK